MLQIKIDEEDFIKALENWYWCLDEYNNTHDEEFNNVLKKYNLTLKDIGVSVQ